MFDTMTVTKSVGAVCGSLLVFLLGNWAATSIYAMGAGGHGGEGEEHAQAYTIEVASAAPAAGAEAAPAVDVAALLAAGDAAAGEKVFSKCKACHHVDGKDATGPHLNGVVGRPIAEVPGFAYSASMAAHHPAVWDAETLFHFLENPKAFAADTKMKFAGIPKPEDRANLIAFLAAQN
ncbi:c-type cytochrome [Xinfangfangia pollutisoli]|uniref:c-type cytochrome n=1 Tax=Xinfangfangia pollutisoli TaxID=2865960 RepID=UPI001CD45435|nr:cytochrome c family protein [Xinfangfangia pollutisoli]